LHRLGLGACLADDMGLGKTLPVLALLLALKARPDRARDAAPALLVVPASLIANWQAEIDRFAPSLHVLVAHPSAEHAVEAITPPDLGGVAPRLTTHRPPPPAPRPPPPARPPPRPPQAPAGQKPGAPHSP